MTWIVKIGRRGMSAGIGPNLARDPEDLLCLVQVVVRDAHVQHPGRPMAPAPCSRVLQAPQRVAAAATAARTVSMGWIKC